MYRTDESGPVVVFSQTKVKTRKLVMGELTRQRGAPGENLMHSGLIHHPTFEVFQVYLAGWVSALRWRRHVET
ncbi:hypothetical protein X797_004907 [Metarhizium robertsii]|uniref:Uncharacterized protein n=1 Tax=Metarhizium robertsii TaxID=568076 RepID=A0A0A1UWW3_9HYPO|nr:hypothetical protein X797_004907 [Metarhizium robertsii]